MVKFVQSRKMEIYERENIKSHYIQMIVDDCFKIHVLLNMFVITLKILCSHSRNTIVNKLEKNFAIKRYMNFHRFNLIFYDTFQF